MQDGSSAQHIMSQAAMRLQEDADLAALVTALKDTLLATKCCETCANGYDCCCEWQAGDPDDCKPGAWGHWAPASVNEILRRKSQADEAMGRETPTTAYVNRKEGQR